MNLGSLIFSSILIFLYNRTLLFWTLNLSKHYYHRLSLFVPLRNFGRATHYSPTLIFLLVLQFSLYLLKLKANSFALSTERLIILYANLFANITS